MNMARFKTQPQPQSTPDKGRSLEEQIIAARDAAAEFVEARVQEIKGSPEGSALPLDWLRMNLRATTRAGQCSCKAALVLLDEAKKHDR
jgi:hypothetical protein